MKDLIIVIAYFNVYGLPIYTKRYHGFDAGKDNLRSYFVGKRKWSLKRLSTAVKILRDNGIILREKADVGSKLYSTYMDKHWQKILLNLVD